MDKGQAQKCVICGTRVRDDLVDHKFFGFAAGCPKAASSASAKSLVQQN